MKLSKSFFILILIFLCTLFYNEYLIYRHLLYKCDWPASQTESPDPDKKLLNVLLISDTHLFSSSYGHLINKLRIEWQQYQAFQTAQYYLKPDYIVNNIIILKE